MNLSEAIRQLSALQEKFGDLPIGGGYLSDDNPPHTFTPTLLRDSMENWESPEEIFIE
jgi:hypothetical protein